MAWAEAYLRTKWHLDPSSRLATTDMGRKLDSCACPLFGEGAGSPSNTMSLGPRPTSYQLASRSFQPFGHNRYGLKIGGGLCPFWGGGTGSPSNTVWPGLRPTFVPSFILIRPTVWPQYTNVTGRTDRETDNGPIALGKPFYKRSPN